MLNISSPLLDVQALNVTFDTPDAQVEAVKNLNFQVQAGQCLGLVGESGSGKSQTVLAALGLLAQNANVTGKILFEDKDLLELPAKKLNTIRGSKIAMIFQDPLTALTPHMTIGAQMREVLARHKGIKGQAANNACMEWLEKVRIPEASRRLLQYPHELSGGMRQRVMIATAMLCEPSLLLADEPTTALDVTVQAQVLELMNDLIKETNAGLVLITHDMGVVARMCSDVVVMRKGEAVETATVDDIFSAPKHEYTKMLLDAMPRLDSKGRGNKISVDDATKPNLQVRNLGVSFPVAGTGGLFKKKQKLRAVDEVSFSLKPGETLGIVGESGCGKSTLSRAILRLIDPHKGGVSFLGRDILKDSQSEFREHRKDLQIVFQDPVASLNPRMTIGQSIAEPFSVFRPEMSGEERENATREMMERVGLEANMINRYPHELSGGQNQRVGIARAMILKPQLLVCDEAVSALDVSVQSQIIDLLIDLQNEFGMSMLFISHDLSVVREISHRVMVLYLGRVVELASVERIFNKAKHPYTKALIEAVPQPDPKSEKQRKHVLLSGDLPSPLDPKAGLRFMKSRLSETGPDQYRPLLHEVTKGHFVAEHDPIDRVTEGLVVR
ncbi:dipeptide ABC transporter ATP-binding protein [Hirschia litorea]|uniref:Dipeptide ABC transporter ATP-binding protein n=1 Tax=Hirschia litorea TaxID=1199156 RepID=A0ABW2IN34_9PROT